MLLQEYRVNWQMAKELKESWQHSRSAEVHPSILRPHVWDERLWLSPKTGWHLNMKKRHSKKQRRDHDGLRSPLDDDVVSS
jgi:hypothetical protein